MQWPLALMIIGDLLLAAGLVYSMLELRNNLRARRALVAKLAEDSEFVAELRRQKTPQSLDRDVPHSEVSAAEIDRLQALIADKIRALDPLGQQLMTMPLRQPTRGGRARFVMSIAQLVDRRLQRAHAQHST